MKNKKAVLILVIILILDIFAFSLAARFVCINKQKIKNQFMIWLGNVMDTVSGLEVNERGLEFKEHISSWKVEGNVRIRYNESGKSLEYLKDTEKPHEKVTLLNSVIDINDDYITGRFYVLAEYGYAIADWQDNIRIYTTEEKVNIENVRYLESFEEFTKEEQEAFESMKPLFPRVKI